MSDSPTWQMPHGEHGGRFREVKATKASASVDSLLLAEFVEVDQIVREKVPEELKARIFDREVPCKELTYHGVCWSALRNPFKFTCVDKACARVKFGSAETDPREVQTGPRMNSATSSPCSLGSLPP